MKKVMAHKAIKKMPAASKKAAAPKKSAAPKTAAKKIAEPVAAGKSAAKPRIAAARPAPVKAKPESAPARPKPAAAPTLSKSPPAKAKPSVLKTKSAPAPTPPKTLPPPKRALAAAPAAVATAPKVAPAMPMAPPPPRKSGRGASKYMVAQAPMPLPPPTSRFADRFAPPRPPTRQMNNLELDVPKHAQKSDPKLANAWKSKAGRDLTEPEVLAMPESEYMNEKQLEFFRAKLQALKDDLLSNAGETTEHLREDTSIVPDPADRATIEEEHALELRTRDRERKLLKKISQSLGRIESGDYGFCDETGEPIGLGRLIARPTATLSLEAQQRRELKQKMFGD